MIKFIADSGCDLKEFPEICFETVPLEISTDERIFTDDLNLDVHEMLDYLLAYHGRSYTACPSTEKWMAAFEGADEIYAVTLTSGLSGTFSAACAAKEMYLAEHPETKICVIDSLSTGPEMYLILEKLAQFTREGKTFEEISAAILEYRKTTRLFFAFQSIHNLAQNGRVNKLVASAVGIMNIRIVGTASPEGTIQPLTKCRGDKKALEALIKELKTAGYAGGKFRISQIENEPYAEQIAAAVKENFGTSDIQILPSRGLCSYYAERGGIILACEC